MKYEIGNEIEYIALKNFVEYFSGKEAVFESLHFATITGGKLHTKTMLVECRFWKQTSPNFKYLQEQLASVGITLTQKETQ